MRLISILVAGAALSSCADVPPAPTRTPERQQEYERLIAGKVALAPMTCLPAMSGNDMVRIDDETIAFRDGRRVYVSHMRGACNGIASGMNTLVTRETTGPGPCAGDIARVVDMSARMTVGSCAWGEFIPYVPPGTRY